MSNIVVKEFSIFYSKLDEANKTILYNLFQKFDNKICCNFENCNKKIFKDSSKYSMICHLYRFHNELLKKSIDENDHMLKKKIKVY